MMEVIIGVKIVLGGEKKMRRSPVAKFGLADPIGINAGADQRSKGLPLPSLPTTDRFGRNWLLGSVRDPLWAPAEPSLMMPYNSSHGDRIGRP